MTNGQLLWVDDEMELLKAQVLFLQKKGYDVTTTRCSALKSCRLPHPW